MQPTDPSQGNPAAYGQPQQPAPGYGPPADQPAQGYPPGAPPAPGYGPPTGYIQQAPRRQLLPLFLGDALTAFGGLLVFAFSFAPFVGYSDDMADELDKEHLPTSFSAWSLETFMAPLTWFVALAGLGVIALAAIRLIVPRDRERLGFRTGHLQVGLGLFLIVAMFGYAVSNKSSIFGHDLGLNTGDTSGDTLAMSLGWGGYLMLFGALIAAVGAILSHLNIGPTIYPIPPKAPAMYPPQQYGAPQYAQGAAQYGAGAPPQQQYAPAPGAAETAAYPVVTPQNAPQPQSAPPAQNAQQPQNAPQSAPPQQYQQESGAQWPGPQDTSDQWPGQPPR